MAKPRFTIEDITNGKCAIKNDDADKTRKLISLAFPTDKTSPTGSSRYYYRSLLSERHWTASDIEAPFEMKVQLASEFILPSDVQPIEFNLTFKNDKAMSDQVNTTKSTDKRFPFTLTEADAKRIIKAACAEWALKLANWWGVPIIRYGHAMVPEETYKIMRAVCTADQHALFDEIFGKDEPPCPYKDGELIVVRDKHLQQWILRYSNGQMSGKNARCYDSQKRSGATNEWRQHHKIETGMTLPD